MYYILAVGEEVIPVAETQMRKGVLELVVLATLKRRPTYGGVLLEALTESFGTEMSAGTVYPLLARLRKNGALTTHWEESPVGPPRKIYRLTTLGVERLRELHADWNVLVDAVTTAVKGTTL